MAPIILRCAPHFRCLLGANNDSRCRVISAKISADELAGYLKVTESKESSIPRRLDAETHSSSVSDWMLS